MRFIVKRIRRALSTLSAATFILLLVIHFTPLTSVWARALAGDWTDSNGDTLIVLSGEIESDGVLGPGSYLRTLYALRAWRDSHSGFRTILVAGGRPRNAPESTGEAMREFLIGNGVPTAAIRVENRSLSTRENAVFLEPLLGPDPGRTVLLTSDFHMFRARRVFERAGIHVIPRPVPDVLKHSNHVINRWNCFWALGMETVKIGYYAWKGWL